MYGPVLSSAPPADDIYPMCGRSWLHKCASKGLVTIASASLMEVWSQADHDDVELSMGSKQAQ